LLPAIWITLWQLTPRQAMLRWRQPILQKPSLQAQITRIMRTLQERCIFTVCRQAATLAVKQKQELPRAGNTFFREKDDRGRRKALPALVPKWVAIPQREVRARWSPRMKPFAWCACGVLVTQKSRSGYLYTNIMGQKMLKSKYKPRFLLNIALKGWKVKKWIELLMQQNMLF